MSSKSEIGNVVYVGKFRTPNVCLAYRAGISRLYEGMDHTGDDVMEWHSSPSQLQLIGRSQSDLERILFDGLPAELQSSELVTSTHNYSGALLFTKITGRQAEAIARIFPSIPVLGSPEAPLENKALRQQLLQTGMYTSQEQGLELGF